MGADDLYFLAHASGKQQLEWLKWKWLTRCGSSVTTSFLSLGNNSPTLHSSFFAPRMYFFLLSI